MKVCLLGTGAADGIPGLYRDDEISLEAKRHGGRDVRTRSAALIDDHIKIDLAPETALQLFRQGLNASDWSALVFTHSHDDHFAITELQYFLYPFTELEYLEFPIFGNARVLELFAEKYPDWPMEVVLTQSFEPFRHLDTTITPIKAYHKLDEDAHNLLIERDGTCLLYATDTGIWQEETWEFLKSVQIDGLVIEATEGLLRTEYYGHLDLPSCIAVVERLREQGTIEPGKPVYTTHHSHRGGLTHAQLEQHLAPAGIRPGYDGLEFEI